MHEIPEHLLERAQAARERAAAAAESPTVSHSRAEVREGIAEIIRTAGYEVSYQAVDEWVKAISPRRVEYVHPDKPYAGCHGIWDGERWHWGIPGIYNGDAWATWGQIEHGSPTSIPGTVGN